MNEVTKVDDSKKNLSTMNLVLSISIIIVVGIWIYLSVTTKQLQHVTAGDALWFTSLFSGKILQSFFEDQKPIAPKTKPILLRVIWIFSVLGIVFTWGYLSIHFDSIQHFTSGDAAWFTALFSSKVGQTYIERSKLETG